MGKYLHIFCSYLLPPCTFDRYADGLPTILMYHYFWFHRIDIGFIRATSSTHRCVLMALVDLEAAKKHTSNSSKRANCASGSPGPRSRLGSKSTKRTMRSVNALTSRKTPPIVRQSREYTRPSSQSSSPIVGRVRNISKEQARRSEKPIQRALSFRGENENTCLENADDTVQMVHIARVLHDQCS